MKIIKYFKHVTWTEISATCLIFICKRSCSSLHRLLYFFIHSNDWMEFIFVSSDLTGFFYFITKAIWYQLVFVHFLKYLRMKFANNNALKLCCCCLNLHFHAKSYCTWEAVACYATISISNHLDVNCLEWYIYLTSHLKERN